jgi:hypothetical protein
MPLHGPKLAVDVGDVQNHPDEITIPRLGLSVMLRHIVVTLTLVLHASVGSRPAGEAKGARFVILGGHKSNSCSTARASSTAS